MNGTKNLHLPLDLFSGRFGGYENQDRLEELGAVRLVLRPFENDVDFCLSLFDGYLGVVVHR